MVAFMVLEGLTGVGLVGFRVVGLASTGELNTP